MTQNKVYIKAATQISMQQPLSEQWMESPLSYDVPYVRSVEPAFREWLNPLDARRMGKILKRALVTASSAMKKADVTQPEAIITGTGLGCIENTELLLNQLCEDGEGMLKPTFFMQSTHNTISSLIAIQGKCHGYNSTYSHRSISFDSALLDAFMQISLGDIQNALVTANDEMTPSYFSILQRGGFLGQQGQVPASEVSAALMLDNRPEGALCEVAAMDVCYSNIPQMPLEGVDAVMVGTNGTPQNDDFYTRLLGEDRQVTLLQYKHLFGECYTASALGVYAAAHLLKKGEAPAHMVLNGDGNMPVKSILLLNHSDLKNVSYVLLKAVV